MARSRADEARLQAITAAKRVHRALDSQKRVAETSGQVDVFEAIAELDIALIFKPLTSALGLCLPRRTLIARPRGAGAATLTLRETQPWREPDDSDPIFALQLDLHGRELGGPSRAAWRRQGVQK